MFFFKFRIKFQCSQVRKWWKKFWSKWNGKMSVKDERDWKKWLLIHMLYRVFNGWEIRYTEETRTIVHGMAQSVWRMSMIGCNINVIDQRGGKVDLVVSPVEKKGTKSREWGRDRGRLRPLLIHSLSNESSATMASSYALCLFILSLICIVQSIR